jgi:hypothetical protein
LETDPVKFKNSFARFEGDELNGWSQDKQEYVGKEATVAEVFGKN